MAWGLSESRPATATLQEWSLQQAPPTPGAAGDERGKDHTNRSSDPIADAAREHEPGGPPDGLGSGRDAGVDRVAVPLVVMYVDLNVLQIDDKNMDDRQILDPPPPEEARNVEIVRGPNIVPRLRADPFQKSWRDASS